MNNLYAIIESGSSLIKNHTKQKNRYLISIHPISRGRTQIRKEFAGIVFA